VLFLLVKEVIGISTHLNADVRWASACRLLVGSNSMIFSKGENAVKFRLTLLGSVLNPSIVHVNNSGKTDRKEEPHA